MATALAAEDAAAQIQQLPGAAEPGRAPRPRPALPSRPAELEWSVQLPPGAEPPAALKSEKLELKDLKLTGVTVYRRDQLAGLFAPYRDKEITFEQFYGIARAIQQRYREDGYILSFAYVPPQTVEDGVFTIAVVEGFVEEVEVEDIEGPLKGRLKALLEPISRFRPLNVRTLERYLLLANDLAGLKVTGVLRPSATTRGGSLLVAKVRRKPVDGGADIDNRGSEFTGIWQTRASVAANSPFGTGERLGLTFSEASLLSEKWALAGSYRQPVGYDGLHFNLNVDYTETTPGFTLEAFDVETTSMQVTADLAYPVIRSRSENLVIGGGFTFRNSAVDLLGQPFTRDRLRLLRASLNYGLSGFLGGSSRAILGLAQAFPVLNATDPKNDDTSRSDASRYFTTATLDLAHVQPLLDRLDFSVSATGQYARTATPASEEFAAGGGGYGRAYNSGEITGEDGVGVSAELVYTPGWKIPALRYLQGYGFYDFGKAWDRSSSASQGGSESLSSAGIGVRTRLSFGLTLRLEYAHPLTKKPSNQTGHKHGRVLLFAGWTY